MVITSPENKLIKKIIKCTDKKYIKQFGIVLIESYKVVCDVSSFCAVENIFVLETSQDKYNDLIEKYLDKVVFISEKVCKTLSQFADKSDIFATIKLPQNNDRYGNKILFLDCIQDPSNLGAIARTARATGFDDIILFDCAYPYSPKAIRSSMGHILGLNLHFGQYEDIVKLKNNSYKTIIADLDGQNAFDYHSNNDKLILVIGNEGSGVSENARQLADTIITLPMENDVESLNASVSASILMYILTK